MSIIANLLGNGQDRFHQVSIKSASLGADIIIASIPEKFSLNSTANYEARFASGLNNANAATQTLSNALQASTGVSLVTKRMSLMTWTSSSPIEFQLPLLFNAISDPFNEVHKPIRNLINLTRPSANDTPNPNDSSSSVGGLANSGGAAIQNGGKRLGQGFIRGPGPTFVEPERNTVTVTIGNIIMMANMIITSVNVEMDSIITQDGYMLSAQADVTVVSSTMMLKEDIDIAFMFGNPANTIAKKKSYSQQALSYVQKQLT